MVGSNHDGVPDPRYLLAGGVLQLIEAGTFGMPLEVWKTRNGAYPKETARESLRAVYSSGGLPAFWRGVEAKLIESFVKGGVLIYAKEGIFRVFEAAGIQRGSSLCGAAAGAGAGVAQTLFMAPLTYVVTFSLEKPTEGRRLGTAGILRNAGIRGCYSCAPAMAMRQASNWGLRQGFNDFYLNAGRRAAGRELSTPERVALGLVAGASACVNQPIEVLRIRVQAEHVKGNGAVTTSRAARLVYIEGGLGGFFAGILPRIGLSAWQTMFMITFADMVRSAMLARL